MLMRCNLIYRQMGQAEVAIQKEDSYSSAIRRLS